MRAGGCFLFRNDGSPRRMVPAASYGFRNGLDKAVCLEVARTLNPDVLDARRPILIPDARRSDRLDRPPGAIQSLVLVPLTIGGEVIGTIHLFNKVPLSAGDDHRFSPNDLRIATILGCQSAVSLRNAELYIERHNLFLDFVESVATSVDLKDRYTHGHSKRVAEHSAGVAAELGFSRPEIKLVALAARLHDVGKIGTPDLLLRKRGRLTQQEFEVIKSHATNAERLFSGRPGWQTLVPGIRHHHERFNSTGYPDGLRGDRIPITARIIAVADAFDAMTSDRPYRRRLSAAEACEEIKACSGSHFDPRIAAAFLRYYHKRATNDPEFDPVTTQFPQRVRPLGAA
jgi:HD-GYP domain-containing protein (c-di-GMP phosphodiesterase class II)